MTALRALTLSEGRLYLRDSGTVFFALVFPTLLLVLMGLVLPGMDEPLTDAPGYEGLRPIDLYVPVVLALAICTTSLTTFPAVFGGYREKGVLRRLATTPLPASRLLVAQVSVNVLALLVAVVAALVAMAAVLGLTAPQQPGLVVLAFALGITHMTALGCVLAALVPTAASGNGLGMLLYFPLLFLAGVWTPGPTMPDTLATVGSYLPLGAAAQAMSEGWFGDGVPVTQLLVMVGWTLVLGPVAARVFRWR
ncbi:ABC transporter permease [Cellulomonas bogoriensis]|uniref:Transport permease protein n=1 Tax=Cellulomonas bogoriensis 69B4 = DSM 16987 TaxID=1386082 RepID=A0A0A0BZP6_9CELL|nr:ABC transporter permease [Cellulomonas bogoriensis]KGM13863.1 ABC transporter [Cellulomonas bogoriensis 69B4 = DSM 16987]